MLNFLTRQNCWMHRVHRDKDQIYEPDTSLFRYTLRLLPTSFLRALLTNRQGCSYPYHKTQPRTLLPVCQPQRSSPRTAAEAIIQALFIM